MAERRRKPLKRKRLESLAELRRRLEEAEQTLSAIRTGHVDALVIGGPKGDQIYTLSGTDHVYRVILETMNEAALTVDNEGMILFCNPQFAGLVRLPMEEVRGQLLTRFVAEAQRAVIERLLEQAKLSRIRSRVMLKAEDGTLVYTQIAASPLEIEGVRSICLVVNDLTELEASTRSVIVLRKQQEEIERSQLELRRAAENLARSNKDLQQFAYVASHDLQEPLRQVITFTRLLRERYRGKLDNKADEFIDFAVDGAERMSHFIRDLLVYSGLQSGTVQDTRVDMNEAFDSAAANCREAIMESGAAITRDHLPSVKGDPTQLVQLIQNLIGNAVKYGRKGMRPAAHMAVRRKKDQWIFSIQDNGIGIPREAYDRIFVIFQRLHPRTKYPGTGIGLAICKKIVERHGGQIWVESVQGSGSTFYFTLPATA